MENNILNYNAPRERVKYAERRGIAFEVLSEDVYDYVALRMIVHRRTLSNALEWVSKNTKGMLSNFTVITPQEYDEVARKIGVRYSEFSTLSRNECKKLLSDIVKEIDG